MHNEVALCHQCNFTPQTARHALQQIMGHPEHLGDNHLSSLRLVLIVKVAATGMANAPPWIPVILMAFCERRERRENLSMQFLLPTIPKAYFDKQLCPPAKCRKT